VSVRVRAFACECEFERERQREGVCARVRGFIVLLGVFMRCGSLRMYRSALRVNRYGARKHLHTDVTGEARLCAVALAPAVAAWLSVR